MKNHQTVGNRKVVFYGRVSTEHEEQTYALGNQMQWYCTFNISFKDALQYRNKRKQLLRQKQYKELKLHMYI